MRLRRFGLRTLLLFVTAAAIVCGYVHYATGPSAEELARRRLRREFSAQMLLTRVIAANELSRENQNLAPACKRFLEAAAPFLQRTLIDKNEVDK